MSKRYINVPKHPGIRKDTVTGKYQALKKINGKQFAETFESIRQAQHWRNVFNGDRASLEQAKTTATLGHVWSRMKELHFPSLELSTRRIWERRWDVLSELGDHRMEDITSTVINRWIERKKKFFTSEEYKAKGMTGHKDLKLADHYSKIDGEVQKETSLKIVEHIRGLGLDKDSQLYTGNVVPLKRTR